jgi:hypothetical protein
MPLNLREERFLKRLRQEAKAIRRDCRAKGMSSEDTRAELTRLLTNDSPHRKVLRAYGENTLQLDWATILKLIVQLLPLLLIFI